MMKLFQQLDQQTPCEQCKYYFGKNSIHCTIYPGGKKTKYCNDFSIEQKNLMINKLEKENFSNKKAASVLLGIAGATLLGYSLYQSVPLAINAYKSYDKYTQECGVFLERAGKAGTTGVAEEELERVVNWLSVNYSTESFEYKDLKNNLNYLKKQPEDLVLPVVIKDSINQNTTAIRSEQIKKRNVGSFGLELIITLLIATPLTIVLVILLGILVSYEEAR